MNINILLFDNFTALDVFGPVEVLSSVDGWQTRFLSVDGGIIRNRQGVSIVTEAITENDYTDAWLIPGGWGTRQLVNDEQFLSILRRIAEESQYYLSVCTGAALLARCGALDGRRATSNKRAFEWVRQMGGKVQWKYGERWVSDGKFFTSAGVSAGIDMALGFVESMLGKKQAEDIADRMEYKWEREFLRIVKFI